MKLEILFISLLYCDSFKWLVYSVYSICEPSVCAGNQRPIRELTDKVLIKVPGKPGLEHGVALDKRPSLLGSGRQGE